MTTETKNTEIMSLEKFEKLKGKKAIEVVTDIDQIKPLIEFVRENSKEALELDMSVPANRKIVGSMARKVSQSKKAITAVIDNATADIQRQLMDAKECKKLVNEECDSIRQEVLKDRNKWEAEQARIEEERVSAIRERIANITAIGTLDGSESIETLQSLIEAIEAMEISADSFSEFSGEALDAKQLVLKRLNDAIFTAIQKQKAKEAQALLDQQQKAAKIEEKLNNLRQIPMQYMVGVNSIQIREKIKELSGFEITEEYFCERANEARQAMELVLTQLGMLADQAEKLEAANVQEEALKTDCSEHVHESRTEPKQTGPLYDPAAASMIKRPAYESQKHDTSRKLPDSGHFNIESSPEDIAARKAAGQLEYMINSLTAHQASMIVDLIREGKIPHVNFTI